MKIVKHNNLESLQEAAKDKNQEVYTCDMSASFRIFDKKGKTTEFHGFYF